MSVKFFRRVVANVFIVIIIALISVTTIGYSTIEYVVTGGSLPIYKKPGSDNVCLMVNVYWGEEYIDKMLDSFDKYDVKTTFFVGGTWAAKNEDLLVKIFESGHEIANHGYFHKDHKKLDKNSNREEISACHNLIKSVLDIEMKYFSPPSASFSSITLDVAEKMGYTTVMYSKDTIDWRDHDADLIYRRATKNIVGGDLILMHPTAATTNALERILAEIKKKGLTATTVSNVISGAVQT